MGGLAAAGSLGSAAIGSHAASSAADKQTAAANEALDFQKKIYGDQVANQQPYVDAGQSSISMLMNQLKGGTFGAGSNPAFKDPTPFAFDPFNAPAPFTAPTATEARNTPGYQFTFDQGMRGVNASAAARGGALSGGALKAAAQYGSGLADTTYNDVFNRSLAGYQTNFSDALSAHTTNFGEAFNTHQANFGDSLASYQANLARQAQEFGQESGVAALGQSGIQSIGNTGTQAATNVGNIMNQIGNAQAGAALGSGQAWANGIGGAVNGVSNAFLLNSLMPKTGRAVIPGSAPGYDPTSTLGFTSLYGTPG